MTQSYRVGFWNSQFSLKRINDAGAGKLHHRYKADGIHNDKFSEIIPNTVNESTEPLSTAYLFANPIRIEVRKKNLIGLDTKLISGTKETHPAQIDSITGKTNQVCSIRKKRDDLSLMRNCACGLTLTSVNSAWMKRPVAALKPAGEYVKTSLLRRLRLLISTPSWVWWFSCFQPNGRMTSTCQASATA